MNERKARIKQYLLNTNFFQAPDGFLPGEALLKYLDMFYYYTKDVENVEEEVCNMIEESNLLSLYLKYELMMNKRAMLFGILSILCIAFLYMAMVL